MTVTLWIAAVLGFCLFVWIGGLGFIAAVFEAVFDALCGDDS